MKSGLLFVAALVACAVVADDVIAEEAAEQELSAPNRKWLSFSAYVRLDYRLAEHIGLFAFVGQFCLVSDDARSATKSMKVPEARRDLTYGGVCLALDF